STRAADFRGRLLLRSSPRRSFGAQKSIISVTFKSAGKHTARFEVLLDGLLNNPMSPNVVRTANFAADAANFVLGIARKSLDERGEFSIALSGGNTPRPVYSQIATTGRDLAWDKVSVTFGDERCVPPDDEQSNYRMAQETLLGPASVPE